MKKPDLALVWAAVYAASYVHQHAEEGKRTGSPGEGVYLSERFAEEACAVADVAVEALRERRLEKQPDNDGDW